MISPKTQLTDREIEVLDGFAHRLSNAEIAEQMGLTVGTVKWYAQQIFNKLGVSNRKEAVRSAEAAGGVRSATGNTPQSIPHNLPTQFTSFVGRETELTSIENSLSGTRLLTLTGPGGVGKTRLAIQAATHLLPHFVDGVFWIPLYNLTDAELIIHAIAEAVGVRDSGSQPLYVTVTEYLKQRRVLLLLDNFEHLFDGLTIVPGLLSAAPNLYMLVTSREALHVVGEAEHIVHPLSLTDQERGIDELSIMDQPACALFIDRARAANANFLVDSESAQTIAEICLRLDGLPLAIELAAARSRLFSPKAILSRLDSRLTVISNSLLDSSGRHQALRATLDWSYELLTPAEQQLFNRLSVFGGGWSLQAAEAVCSDLPVEVVFDGLSTLADKSLIRQETDHEGEPRFWMLYILREYACERLEASADAGEIAGRHSRYYLTLAERIEPRLHGIEQPALLIYLDTNHENMRIAINWFVHQHYPEEALRITAALSWYWIMQDHHSEGYRIATHVLEISAEAPPTLKAAVVLKGYARLAYHVGHLDKLQQRLEEALEESRRTDDHYSQAWAHGYLGLYQEICAGNRQKAIEYCQLSADLFRREYSQDHGRAWLLNALGVMYTLTSEFDKGEECFEQALGISRGASNVWGVRMGLQNLGLLCFQRGALLKAIGIQDELLSLIIHRTQNLYMIAEWICVAGLICAHCESIEDSATLLGGVDKILLSNALHLGYPENVLYDECKISLQAALAPELFKRRWQAGQVMSVDSLVETASRGLLDCSKGP